MKKEKLNKLYKKAVMLYYIAVLFLLRLQVVYADGFASSKVATGTTNLIKDVTTWFMILIPSCGALLALYFLLRKNAATEQEQHVWDKRLKIDGACVIGGTVASSLINVIISYYK